MPTIRSPRFLTALAASLAASLAATAMAVAGEAKPGKVITDPYLVVTSNGAYVDYNLDRRPASQSVTIDGEAAKVKLVDKDERLYVALVNRPSLEQGRSYRVRITVRTKAGETVRLSERMFLHKRHKIEKQ